MAEEKKDMERVVEDGEEVLTEEDTCSEDELEEAVGAFILGDITLAQLEGMSAEEMYAIADVGYDLLEEGRLEEAQQIFEGLNVYNPMDAYFHTALGSIYQQQEKYDESIDHYEAAVQLYPDDIGSWTNAGEVLLMRAAQLNEEGNVERAGELFEGAVMALGKAIELDPEGETGSSLRARALVSVAAEKYEEKQAS